MARKRGKMALYEVMSKARARSEQSRTVEPLQPVKKPEPVVKAVKPVPVVEKKEAPEPQEKVNWRKKPRILQYNLGRIEFSIPYQLAITAGLGLVLLLLLAYRVGQFSADNSETSVAQPAGASGGNNGGNRSDLPGLASPTSTSRGAPVTDTPVPETIGAETTEPESRVPEAPIAVPVMRNLGDPNGTNVIVLAQHNAPTQLQPVKEYFMANGIITQIVAIGNTYQLWTKDKFLDNPANPGTKGYDVIKLIEKLGKDYKAPQGFESFAPHKFSDAYGRKVGN